MLTKEFFLAGAATFTIEVPAGGPKSHYTYRINKVEASGNFTQDAYFVNLLTGPDNDSDYTYLGMLKAETGELILTRKSAFAASTFPVRLVHRTFARVWANEQDVIVQAGFKLHHEGRCGRCNRLLTTPESCERGIGPECHRKLLEA